MRARGFTALLFAVVLAPVSVRAQTAGGRNGDEAAKQRARQLGEQGLELFDQGDYAGALARLDEADALTKAPTLGLYAARCLVKLGRWTQASERYAAVARMNLPPRASSVLKAALVDADKERAALLSTIPTLEVGVEGSAADGANVDVDGVPVDSSMLGQRMPLDPGLHRVRASRGELAASEEIRLGASESKRVVLRLSLPVSAPPPRAPSPAVPAPDEPPRSIQPTIGYVALGAGGVGLGVWAVTGFAALSRAGELQCDAGQCPTTQDDVGSLNALRTASAIGFWAGLGCAAIGATLLLTAPKSRTPRQTSIQPWIGPGTGGARAAF